MQLKLPNVISDVDRWGNARFYVRKRQARKDVKVRLRSAPGKPDFLVEYQEAMAKLGLKVKHKGKDDEPAAARPLATLGDLAEWYFHTPKFIGLDLGSQRLRRAIIEQALAEPTIPGGTHLIKDCPIAKVTLEVFEVIRDRKMMGKTPKPGAANNRVKYLRAMMAWAFKKKVLKSNPARDLESVAKASKSGFYTWTREDVDLFLARHPGGTKAHHALTIILYTGLRRGDASKFGYDHVKGGLLRVTPTKTAKSSGVELQLPILEPLKKTLDALTHNRPTFLLTEYGKPFTPAGFGGWFKDRCREVEGLNPRATAHGLRKAGATFAAEAGATTEMLKAMYGWTTSKQADVYVQAANQKKLAAMGMPALLSGGVPLLGGS